MVHPIVKEYLDFYAENWFYLANKLGKMTDHPEFVSIVNGGMIGLDKQVGFPKDAPPAVPKSDEIPRETPKFEEKPKDVPKAPNENKPNAVPESVPGEWPYDKDHMHWNFCAVCHNRDIDQVSEKSQRPYQACVPCKVYLNADGKAVRIGTGERVKAVGKPGERWTWIKVEA